MLLSGNHGEIKRWRRERALERTLRWRPDLLAKAELSAEDLAFSGGVGVWEGGVGNSDQESRVRVSLTGQ